MAIEQLYNLEAEQLLIGVMLTDNRQYERIEDIINVDCFYQPLHQKIFNAIVKTRSRGVAATEVTLKTFFDEAEFPGSSDYLAKIAAKSLVVVDVIGLARALKDLFLRRSLTGIGEDIAIEARNNIEADGARQIELAEHKLFNLATKGSSENSALSLADSLVAAIGRIEEVYKNKHHVQGLPTGFTDLDRLLCGMQRSDLLILAGRPSMGKTAFAINMAINAARALQLNQELDKKRNLGVAFFSLEMSTDQLASRILAMESSVNSSKIRSGMMSKEDLHQLIITSQDISDLPFYIDDTPALSIGALRTRVRRMHRVGQGVGLIVVDYLQLLRGSVNYHDNRVQEISEITQGLKALAKELNVPVLALSQLSRDVEKREDKRPQLSDLRESGTIEQDSDVVMFIYREEYYERRSQPKEGTDKHREWQEKMEKISNQAEIIIAKQRNGPIGKVQLHFDASTTKFQNLFA